MKKLVMALVICIFAFGLVRAQDPGNQDSLIVRITEVDTNVDTIYVWLWAVTDDSVFFYNCPLRFDATGDGITYDHATYFTTLLQWDDVFDSFLVSEDYLRMVGWGDIGGDDNPPLQTLGNRVHILNLLFTVDHNVAQDQYVFIDTTHDDVNGSLLFGLVGGVQSFVPSFTAGWIKFGDPEPLGVDDEVVDIPNDFALNQNYPNPFNPQTNLSFDLPKTQHVSLDVYNILGQHVQTLANGTFEAGRYSYIWNGKNNNGADVPSGIYFYSLKTDEFTKTNKMMLIR